MKIDIRSISYQQWLKGIIISLVILSGYSALFSFNAISIDPVVGSTWHYAVSKTLTLNPPLIFGKDIGLTYGPLASLWGPVLLDSTFWPFFGLGWVISILITVLTIYLAINFAIRSSGWQFWILALLSILYPILPGCIEGLNNSDIQWIQLGLMLTVIAVKTRVYHRKKYSILLLSLLSVLGMFFKFSIGIHLLALFIIVLALNIYAKKNYRLIYPPTILYLIGLIAFWWILTDSGIISLIKYFHLGFQISSGYSEYMISYTPKIMYLFPIIILMLNVALGFYSGGIRLSIILLCNSFFLFKYGFVRADSYHILIFFAGQWFIILCLTGIRTIRKNTVISNILFIILLIIWFLGYQFTQSRAGFGKFITPNDRFIAGLSKMPLAFQPSKSFNTAKKTSNNSFYHLKEKYSTLFIKLEKYCNPNKTITFLPQELWFAELVNCRWQPLPTLQLYNSWCTGQFMDRDREIFSGKTTPDYLVIGSDAIDSRSPIAEMSHILKYILERYEIIDNADNFLILRKRGKSLLLKFVDYGGKSIGSKLLFIQAKGIKNQPWFEIQRLLFKGPQLSVQIISEHRKRTNYFRVYATQLETGCFFTIPGTDIKELFNPIETPLLNEDISIMFYPEVFTDFSLKPPLSLNVQSCDLIVE